MSATHVSVVGAEQVIAMLGQLAQRTRDLRPAMRDIGAHLRSEAVDNFKEQRSPDGQAWRPLSAASILSRARQCAPKSFAKRRAQTIARFASGAQALLNTGALRNSIQVQEVTATSVTVGTRLAYAAIHQFGGMAGRNRKVRIPARPFVGLSAQGAQRIVDTLRGYLLQEAA